MDTLESYRILAAVVDSGGFSAAAKAMRLTTAKVSRAISDLEEACGVQLLARTTRRVAVTEKGEAFLRQLRPALVQLEDAGRVLSGDQKDNPIKILRLSCCRASGLGLVSDAATSFLVGDDRFSLTLDLHDRAVDADNEGFDLVLAIAPPGDKNIPDGHSLASIELVIVAAPGYVAMHKRPQSPSELVQHRLLVWSGMPRWDMRDGTHISPLVQYSSNDLNIIKNCCIAARGVALLPAFMLTESLRDRALVQLLDGFEPKPLQLRAKWGRRSQPNAAAAAFLKHLTQHLRLHPI